MRKIVLLVTALVLAFTLLLPPEILACYYCDKSPNGWGFCKPGASRGHGDCTTVVVDAWSGRTGCEIWGWGNCYHGGTTYPDDPPPGPDYRDTVDNNPCSWTDRETVRLV